MYLISFGQNNLIEHQSECHTYYFANICVPISIKDIAIRFYVVVLTVINFSFGVLIFKALHLSVPEICRSNLGSIFILLNITNFQCLKTKCWSLCIQLTLTVFKAEYLKNK